MVTAFDRRDGRRHARARGIPDQERSMALLHCYTPPNPPHPAAHSRTLVNPRKGPTPCQNQRGTVPAGAQAPRPDRRPAALLARLLSAEDLAALAGGDLERRSAVAVKAVARRIVVREHGLGGPGEDLPPASVDNRGVADLARVLEDAARRAWDPCWAHEN